MKQLFIAVSLVSMNKKTKTVGPYCVQKQVQAPVVVTHNLFVEQEGVRLVKIVNVTATAVQNIRCQR